MKSAVLNCWNGCADQARSFGTEFVTDRVIGVDLLSEEKTVFGNNGTYTGKSVIIATGSMGRGTRVKGEDELLGRGVSYCATCDAAFFRDQEVLVAGNNDEAIEEGLYLTKFASQVHFLSPTSELKAPKDLADELIANPKVMLYKESQVCWRSSVKRRLKLPGLNTKANLSKPFL